MTGLGEVNLNAGDEELLTVILKDEGEEYNGPDIGPLPKEEDDDVDVAEDKVNAGSQKKDDDLITIDLDAPQEEITQTDESDEQEIPAGKGEYNYKEVVRYAIDKGVFTDTALEELDALPDDLDGLSTVLQKELKTGIDVGTREWIDAINAKSEGLVEHLLNGGNVNDFVKVVASDYNTIKPEALKDISLQEKLVREDYKESTNWSDEKIDKYITKLKDLDELKDEAGSSLKGLQERSAQRRVALQQQTLQNKQQQELQQSQRIDFINKTIAETTEFAGVKITPKLRGMVTDNIMNDKTFNKINSNLDAYRVKLAYLDSLGLLDGDVSNIKKVITDKVAKNVKQEIVDYDFTRGGSKSKAPASKATTNKDSIKSVISQIDGAFSDDFFN